MLACNAIEDETPKPSSDSSGGQEVVAVDSADLAEATVQIFAMEDNDSEWTIVWSGSGSVVSPDGMILTNAHVVDNRYDEYTDLGVAIIERTDKPPELTYLADIATVDYGLDIAVIRIVSNIDGNPVTPQLSYIQMGDSDAIEIGDHLRILGYPGIGGDTITYTEGAVSGFTRERGVDGRAWIKTDATIAGGNSGGMAVNAAGELIGVPTQASASDESEVVDCRPVADTNRDGYIDDNDTCVPIGGFINGLRPVNLARPLVEAAISGEEYVADMQTGGDSSEFDLSEIFFYHLQFADGVTEDDQPTGSGYSLPSGISHVCAFWDYDGMIDGMTWSAYWFVSGEMSEEGSFLDTPWGGGEAGNWWVCIDDDTGVKDGLYELVLEVEGTTMISDSIYIGGNRSEVDFTIRNQSGEEIWYIQISPTEAQNWGQDKLGPEEVLEPGAERSVAIASGVYDLALFNAEDEIVVEEYEIEVRDDFIYTYTE
jgi:S1-C subfamily serine protease